MKWLADVVQSYSAIADLNSKAGSIMPTVRRNALLVQLSLRAPSAREAMEKAAEWLTESKIEDAYVSQVCRVQVDRVDLCSLESWPVNKEEGL